MNQEPMLLTATEAAPRIATVKHECEDFRIVHFAAKPDMPGLCCNNDERYDIEKRTSFNQSTGEPVSYWAATYTDSAIAKSILDNLTK